MSKKFNLLLLHQPTDIHPRSWICIKGRRLKIILKKLEKDVCKNTGWSRWRVAEEIATKLHCAHNTIENKLCGDREFFPIVLTLQLLQLSKERKKFLKEIERSIDYLKVNSASAKPVKATFGLNESWAKILGAFMADGSLSIQVVIAASQPKDLNKVKRGLKTLGIHYSSGKAISRNQYYISIRKSKNNEKPLNESVRFLSPSFFIQTHYYIELSDEYKDNVEAFNKWIEEELDIKPTSFGKKRGSWGKDLKSWRVCFSNKILARYLMCFFGVMPGKKTYTAQEPEIIKRSGLNLKKAFAKGLLMFDGCVTKQSKINFTTKSKYLFLSVKQIWEKDKIIFGQSINHQRKEFNLFTTSENTKEKLSKYFEPNTQKWKLLEWLSGNLSKTPVLHQNSSLSAEKVFRVLQKTKCCDAIFLKDYFKCGHSTIRTHLKILKRQGKIKLSDRPNHISKYTSKDTTILLKDEFHKLLFERIREKFKKDKNFAIFLEVPKATLSAWRVRKNRIPIYILKEMCKNLDLNFNQASRNIIKTDREIAEII